MKMNENWMETKLGKTFCIVTYVAMNFFGIYAIVQSLCCG